MFGVGLLAGAGLGLMFAPRTGREMRRELGTRVQDVTRKIGDVTHNVTNKIKQKVGKGAEDLTSALDENQSLYGGSDYSNSAEDFSTGLGGGMDSGRTGLTNSST
jgi:gas vesicle protein